MLEAHKVAERRSDSENNEANLTVSKNKIAELLDTSLSRTINNFRVGWSIFDRLLKVFSLTPSSCVVS